MVTTYRRTVRPVIPAFLMLLTLLILPSPIEAQGVTSTRMQSTGIPGSWSADTNQGRLFLFPTARTIPKGHISINLIELILPYVAVGVSDDLTLSAGTPLLSTASFQEWWITGKYRLRSGSNVNTAVAGMTIFGAEEIWGAFYGVVTVGSPDASVTAGLGMAYFGDDLAKSGAFTIGGEFRPGHGDTKLITEHFFLPQSDPISTLGVRFIGNHINVELGIARVWAKRDPDVPPLFDMSGFLPVIIIALGL